MLKAHPLRGHKFACVHQQGVKAEPKFHYYPWWGGRLFIQCLFTKKKHTYLPAPQPVQLSLQLPFLPLMCWDDGQEWRHPVPANEDGRKLAQRRRCRRGTGTVGGMVSIPPFSSTLIHFFLWISCMRVLTCMKTFCYGCGIDEITLADWAENVGIQVSQVNQALKSDRHKKKS